MPVQRFAVAASENYAWPAGQQDGGNRLVQDVAAHDRALEIQRKNTAYAPFTRARMRAPIDSVTVVLSLKATDARAIAITPFRNGVTGEPAVITSPNMGFVPFFQLGVSEFGAGVDALTAATETPTTPFGPSNSALAGATMSRCPCRERIPKTRVTFSGSALTESGVLRWIQRTASHP